MLQTARRNSSNTSSNTRPLAQKVLGVSLGGGPDSQVQRGITKFIKPGIHLAPEPSFQPLLPLRLLPEVPAARHQH